MRPLGKRTRELCELGRDIGAFTSKDVFEAYGYVQAEIRRTLSRAVEYGVLTVDKSATAYVYRVTPGWEMRFKREPPKAKPTTRPQPAPKAHYLNALFR